LSQKNSFYKRVLGIAALLAATGLIFLVYSLFIHRPVDCRKIVDQAVKNENLLAGLPPHHGLAVFLVDTASQCCHPLKKLVQMQEESELVIKVFVRNDFTANDIDNLRLDFSIAGHIPIETCGDNNRWLNLVKQCRFYKEKSANYLIFFNRQGVFEYIERF